MNFLFFIKSNENENNGNVTSLVENSDCNRSESSEKNFYENIVLFVVVNGVSDKMDSVWLLISAIAVIVVGGVRRKSFECALRVIGCKFLKSGAVNDLTL